MQDLKTLIMQMNEKIDILDTKYNETNEKLEGEVLQECKKWVHMILLKMYINVKHPLGYI